MTCLLGCISVYNVNPDEGQKLLAVLMGGAGLHPKDENLLSLNNPIISSNYYNTRADTEHET